MEETLKLKYRRYCTNPLWFYKFIDEWNSLTLNNPKNIKEAKLAKITTIKEQEPKLYQIMMEDLKNDIL